MILGTRVISPPSNHSSDIFEKDNYWLRWAGIVFLSGTSYLLSHHFFSRSLDHVKAFSIYFHRSLFAKHIFFPPTASPSRFHLSVFCVSQRCSDQSKELIWFRLQFFETCFPFYNLPDSLPIYWLPCINDKEESFGSFLVLLFSSGFP